MINLKKKIKNKKLDMLHNTDKTISKRVSTSHMRLCLDISNFCFDDNIKITFPDINNLHYINVGNSYERYLEECNIQF